MPPPLNGVDTGRPALLASWTLDSNHQVETPPPRTPTRTSTPQRCGDGLAADSLNGGLSMTRSHKLNDRDHTGVIEGGADGSIPKFFGKHGFADANPNKTKKNGGGRGNWGINGDEIEDMNFPMTNARRRSNSSSYAAGLKDFRTKFEEIETEVVFEEELHGPRGEDDQDLNRATTLSSESGGSVDEEEKPKQM